ncbi:ATP-dependent zinc metalloprotease FtsH [Candidatus Nomurabacteria bacterium]|uniref:ATP-dependent zinc metalloprotease FtsH n=1 Tax=Candidatus Dojkabacteria bacterium TaxID=2099670 RepID=A0A955I540_9BACT|nr:ATP-dependent zinc metalloprotease FtsH [Candidatus Dojkabacteria bacterium]MCB9789679.1 ATP-dependent zinc metalloprotease FtsH [Candidatus Nomurabacteria bacterium]MCB9804018.1 ATP-dependent zinc metalloprotease FtsH [Candidatus Nomurabacteria bacterium]
MDNNTNTPMRDLVNETQKNKTEPTPNARPSQPQGSGQRGMNPPSDIRKFKHRRRPSNTSLITTVAIAITLLFVWNFLMGIQSKGDEVSLSKIVRQVEDGDYEKIILKDDSVILEYEKDDVLMRRHALLTARTDFYERLDDAGVSINEIQNDFYEPNVALTIGDVISIVLLGAGLALVYMMLKSMQSSGGKIMDFGQSKARLIFGKKTGISFEDVAGIEEVKEELIEVVDFLKNPKKYVAIGARIPKGVLLVGAPGTGKTLLAKAVAGEAGVPFFHTSGSEFEEMLVGAGASRVRDLFTKAKKAAPCIIFIDEIDAVAKKRGTVLHSGAGEQTLNQILVEMDGLESRENVIVLAATNRPDVLDPAILRPGRFDRSVVVEMPEYEGRLAILKVHSKNKKFANNVDLTLLAKKTIGYSGADLENLLNEAAIMAVKEDRKTIEQDDLLEAYLKVKLGRQKRNKRTEEDLKRVAYHEAGHAVVAKLTKGAHPVEKISIVSRGMTGGVTVYVPEEEQTMVKVSQMVARITSAVAGKVAEEVFLEEMTTGASGDIKAATEVARAMVQRYGMSEKLGFVTYGNLEEVAYLGYQYGGDKDYSDSTAETIDQEVKRIIDEAQDNARKILQENSEIVKELVALLLKQEHVEADEFNALFEKVTKK